MKKLILMLFVCIVANVSAQSNKIKDGLYLVNKMINDSAKVISDSGVVVNFNKEFLDNVPEGITMLLLNTTDFIPLELSAEPILISQKSVKQKKIQMEFSRNTSEKLEKFTSQNLMRQVAIVIDGKAITVHEIRAVIKGGKMEITSSSANECERIFVKLKDHVIK